MTATETLVTRPNRPRKAASFPRIALFLALLLGAYLLAQGLFFRSGFYAGYVEPEYSPMGSVETTMTNEIHREPTGRKEVLVVGNSRIAEGFSPRIANEQSIEAGYWFINFGIPATGDRAWYYLVRDIDPHRDRYAAITLMIDDYDDPDDYEDVADRVSEMPMLINRLHVTDIVPYTMSFTTWKSRYQVFRGLLFPGTVYQGDFYKFLEHPTTRLDTVDQFRTMGWRYGYDYEGMDHSLAGLSVDYEHQRITSYPPGMSGQQQNEYRDFFFHEPEQTGRLRDLEVRWLAPLVDLYRNSKTRIIIFQIPRNPAPNPKSLAHLPLTCVDELRKRPWVKIIDRHTFEDLEKPELFGDHVHLNAVGRKLFTPHLVDVVMKALQ